MREKTRSLLSNIQDTCINPETCTFCKISKGLMYATKYATIYTQNNNAAIIHYSSQGIIAIPTTHIANLKKLNNSDVDSIAHMLLLATQTVRADFSSKQYQQVCFHVGAKAGQTQSHLSMRMRLTTGEKPAIKIRSWRTLRLISQNCDVTIYASSSSHELLLCFNQPIGHLMSLDLPIASKIAHSLLYVIDIIQQQYPTSDYQAYITDSTLKQDQPTIDIRIRLF